MQQAYTIAKWRREIENDHRLDKPSWNPYMLFWRKMMKPQPIQLGFRMGANNLIEHCQEMKKIGVNHIAINVRFNSRGTDTTLEKLAEKFFHIFTFKQRK